MFLATSMNKTVKSFAGGTILALASLLIGFTAHEVSADYSQPTKSQVATENLQTTSAWQYLGTGLSGSVTKVKRAVDGGTRM